jgi:centromeric protein E
LLFLVQHPEREFLLRVSYLEVYNEQIHDLLIPTTQSAPPPVRIRQQTNGMFFADPVREEVVTNVGQVAALISRGERQRHVAGTDWNARSSRSHTIFGIVVESRLYGLNGGVRRSKVCLIDLAGNERASSEVERRSEGSFINKR